MIVHGAFDIDGPVPTTNVELFTHWVRASGLIQRGKPTRPFFGVDTDDSNIQRMREARWILRRMGLKYFERYTCDLTHDEASRAGLWVIFASLGDSLERNDEWELRPPLLSVVVNCPVCSRPTPQLAGSEVHLARRGKARRVIGAVRLPGTMPPRDPTIQVMDAELYKALLSGGLADGLHAWKVLNPNGAEADDVVAVTAEVPLGPRPGPYGYREAPCAHCAAGVPAWSTNIPLFGRPAVQRSWYCMHGGALAITQPVYDWLVTQKGFQAASSGVLPALTPAAFIDEHPDWGFVPPGLQGEQEPDWATLGLEPPDFG